MSRLYVDDFLIASEKSILEALNKMNQIQNGFLIVVSHNKKLLGTLTDGDIRRALVDGANLDDCISSSYQNSCKSVSVQEEFSIVIDIFKNRSVEFLPIINVQRQVVNLITKNSCMLFY